MSKRKQSETSEGVLTSNLSMDEGRIAIAHDKFVDVYNVPSLHQTSTIKTSTPASSVVLSPSSKYLAYATKKYNLNIVELSNTRTYQLTTQTSIAKDEFTNEDNWYIYDNHRHYYDQITALSFSNDETLLASAGHATMGLKGRPLTKMTQEEAIEYSESIPKISVIIWNLDEKRIKNILTGHEGGIGIHVQNITFTSDGQHLVSWGPTGIHSQAVIVWNALSGELLHQFKFREYDIGQIIFSSDNHQFAVVGDMDFHICDLDTGRFISTIPFPAEEAPQWVMKGYEHWREMEKLKEQLRKQLKLN